MDGNCFKELGNIFDGMVYFILGLALLVLVLFLMLVGVGFAAVIYFWR